MSSPHTLTIEPNTHYPQSIVFSNYTATNQPIPKTFQSQLAIFPTLISLDATRTPQSILAHPLTSQSACNNSTASSSFTLLLSNPPIPSNLSTSSLTSLLCTKTMHDIDITTNANRMPTYQLSHNLPLLHFNSQSSV